MRDFIIQGLRRYRENRGRPLRLAIVNCGGTFTALPNPDNDNKLEPVKEQSQLEDILYKGSNLEALTTIGLLDLEVIYHAPIDSSQMLDVHREPLIDPIQNRYRDFDGFIVLHGTDTAAQTAKYLHMAFPYIDVVKYIHVGQKPINSHKPILLISSQESAATISIDGRLIPLPGSDADTNLVTAMAVIAGYEVGEAGMMTNGYEVLGASSAFKASESHFPQFAIDTGVPAIGNRTAFNMILNEGAYLRRDAFREDSIPTVIKGIGNYETAVTTLSEHSHFNLIRAYLDAHDANRTDIVEFLERYVPKVLLYASRGAGNVQELEHKLLKRMQSFDRYIVKVPLPGGRVPTEMHYGVPGEDISGANIEQTAARYKAQSILSLFDSMDINPVRKDKLFYELMTQVAFGKEFLPMN